MNMLFESILMIRGGFFGYEFGLKLIIAIFAVFLCYYDWRTNNRRLDYFWVFLTGTIIWSIAELLLQLLGTRVLQEKYLFGIDITNYLWLTIPLQAMSEGAFVAVFGVFVGDRLMLEEKRKEGLSILIAYISVRYIIFYIVLFSMGYNYANVKIGDPNIPSRRDMFTLGSIIFLSILIAPGIYWFIKTDQTSRKRGLYMFYVMIFTITIWTILEWLTGQRWIEIGIHNPDGTYSNLQRAPPLIEFLALAYDVIVEIVLAYVPFLAIPYLLGLIKSE